MIKGIVIHPARGPMWGYSVEGVLYLQGGNRAPEGSGFIPHGFFLDTI